MPTLAACLRTGLALAAIAPTVCAQSDAGLAETPEAARGRPRWEAGLAVGGGRLADYPGADQSHTRGLVAPVFIYRGPVLRVDAGGIRGRVFGSPDWELDLTATGAFNARDNDARAGMPDLDWLFGLGPQLVYRGWAARVPGLSLHLKTRALFSTDFRRVDSRGATFDPELRWRLPGVGGPSSALTLSVEPTWATAGLQRYFYEVAPEHARPGRPAYAARAGYLGTEVGATWRQQLGPTLSWFVSARAFSMHGAANVDSPLLRDRTNVNVGLGLLWTPWRSEDRVRD